MFQLPPKRARCTTLTGEAEQKATTERWETQTQAEDTTTNRQEDDQQLRGRKYTQSQTADSKLLCVLGRGTQRDQWDCTIWARENRREVQPRRWCGLHNYGARDEERTRTNEKLLNGKVRYLLERRALSQKVEGADFSTSWMILSYAKTSWTTRQQLWISTPSHSCT